MAALTFKAYAKVNLTLEVLGQRDDGYHDIVSIMQVIDLADTLTLEEADGISLDCDDPKLAGPDNLALKAARLLADETGTKRGVRIALRKGIPVAAGLGGGSTDAAAVLRGLDRFWELKLPPERLSSLAAKLGSDVPFFLHGGTAMVQGRGEVVRPIPPADIKWLVVLSPGISIPSKTASLYARLKPSDHTRGLLTRKLEARIRGGGDVPAQFLYNAFDAVAFAAFPGLEAYWKVFESLGAREIHLAGAGPSIFALVPQKEVGTALVLLLRHRGWQAHLAAPVHAVEGGQ